VKTVHPTIRKKKIMRKVSKLVSVLVLASIALPIVSASASPASQYANWKARNLGLVERTSNDIVQFAIDLQNDNYNGFVQDLGKLGRDASAFNHIANSPDTTLNLDIQSFSLDLSNLVYTGRAGLNNTGSVAAFRQAVSAVTHDENVLTSRLKYDNSRW
jgi:hypothetical protein